MKTLPIKIYSIIDYLSTQDNFKILPNILHDDVGTIALPRTG
jgi:hypothetical protein